jgi:AMP deaminase
VAPLLFRMLTALPLSEETPDAASAPAKPLFRNVSLKEYYTDLDALLAVCSDGPAKSFAFRRLKYLASKWNLYCLLNEYQEIADVKVRLCS